MSCSSTAASCPSRVATRGSSRTVSSAPPSTAGAASEPSNGGGTFPGFVVVRAALTLFSPHRHDIPGAIHMSEYGDLSHGHEDYDLNHGHQETGNDHDHLNQYDAYGNQHAAELDEHFANGHHVEADNPYSHYEE